MATLTNPDDLKIFDTQKMLEDLQIDLKRAENLTHFNEISKKHIGKDSVLKKSLELIPYVPPEDRPTIARQMNEVQEQMEDELTVVGIKFHAIEIKNQINDLEPQMKQMAQELKKLKEINAMQHYIMLLLEK